MLNFGAEGISVSTDTDSVNKDIVNLIKVDDDGRLNIVGYHVNDDDSKVMFEHGEGMYLDGMDDVYAAVKELRQRENILVSAGKINEISNLIYKPEEVPIIKESAVAFLTKTNDDYYQSQGIDFQSLVQSSEITDRHGLMSVVSSIAYDIQTEAMKRDSGILDRMLPEGMTREHELAHLSSEAIKYCEDIANLRLNLLDDAVSNKLAEVNRMLAEYVKKASAADPNYKLTNHVESYELTTQGENKFALVNPDDRSFKTSWMSASDMLGHLDTIKSGMTAVFPELEPAVAEAPVSVTMT